MQYYEYYPVEYGSLHIIQLRLIYECENMGIFWDCLYVGISNSWLILSTQFGSNLDLSLAGFAANLLLFIEIFGLQWVACFNLLLGCAQCMVPILFAIPLHQRTLCSAQLGMLCTKALAVILSSLECRFGDTQYAVQSLFISVVFWNYFCPIYLL